MIVSEQKKVSRLGTRGGGRKSKVQWRITSILIDVYWGHSQELAFLWIKINNMINDITPVLPLCYLYRKKIDIPAEATSDEKLLGVPHWS